MSARVYCRTAIADSAIYSATPNSCLIFVPSSASKAAIWENPSAQGAMRSLSGSPNRIAFIRSRTAPAASPRSGVSLSGCWTITPTAPVWVSLRPSLPWLDLYGRCLRLSAAIEAFLLQPPADIKVRKALDKLRRIVRPVECEVPPFASIGTSLCKRSELFNQLRSALQLEDKHLPAGVEPQHPVRKLNDIQSAIGKLTASLRKQRPQRGPAKDTRHAIDLILSHLDRHG